MLNSKRIVVVLPAYNAARTLEQTYREIPFDIVDHVLMVDDHSSDDTVALAMELGIKTIRHENNYGYGRNQKTCYREALGDNADIVVMVHPDYQYTPRLITAMASMIAYEVYDVVLGSRIIGGNALEGGMPAYKYAANRFLTAVENLLLGSKLSEFHTGYRAFSRKVLEMIPLSRTGNAPRDVKGMPLLRFHKVRDFASEGWTCPELRPGGMPALRFGAHHGPAGKS